VTTLASGGADAQAMAALREAAAVATLGHVVVLRVEGEGAFPLLDRVSTAPLYLREGQMRQSLFLDEDARPFADVAIASDELGYFVLAEGPDEAALLGYLERHRPGAAAVSVTSLRGSHELWALAGPYAWEVASALLGPAVLGMTYLSLLSLDDLICFRAGKTGEYGYDLLIPRARLAAVRERLMAVGEPRGLRPVGLAALDQAALENWYFNVRSLQAAARPLTPLELQLQWRVAYDRDFVGAPALRARRAQGASHRATCFSAAQPIAPGAPISLAGRPVGEVLAAGWSTTRGELVGIALIEARYAHPRIDHFVAQGAEGEVPIRTRTPPLLNNRSLHVDPHRHVYEGRMRDVFPPLVVE
jgi:glycine cleavage system aminomethyltransferase T